MDGNTGCLKFRLIRSAAGERHDVWLELIPREIRREEHQLLFGPRTIEGWDDMNDALDQSGVPSGVFTGEAALRYRIGYTDGRNSPRRNAAFPARGRRKTTPRR